MRYKSRVKPTRRPISPPSRERGGIGRGQGDQPELDDIIKSIIATCRSPARVLELYYLSQEPGALEIIRALMALREEGREALWSFLDGAPDPHAISVDVDLWGRVTLSLPEIAEAMSFAPKSAANGG